jgi:hypothetical protein
VTCIRKERRNYLATYTIHDHPADYPDHFVVTRDGIFPGRVVRDDRFLVLASTLELAREHIPPGLACFPRHPSDSPAIVETRL